MPFPILALGSRLPGLPASLVYRSSAEQAVRRVFLLVFHTGSRPLHRFACRYRHKTPVSSKKSLENGGIPPFLGVSREAGCKTRVVSFWLFGFCFSLMIWALGFFLDSCWFWLRFSLWNLLLSVASVCSLLFFLWFFLVWFLCSLSYCSVGLSTCVPYIAFSCPGCPSRPKISGATLCRTRYFLDCD